MNIEALAVRLSDWLKEKFLPVVFADKPIQGFFGGALSSLISASLLQKFAANLQEFDFKLDATYLKRLADDGLKVQGTIPFEVSPSLIPDKFKFLAPLLFDMSLPDPSIKVTLKKEDIYSIIDYFCPGAQTTQVAL